MPLRRPGLIGAAMLTAALAGAVLALGLAVFAWRAAVVPGPLAKETTLIIPQGAGGAAIAAQLGEAGVISNRALFRVASWIGEDGRPLRAGEYAFPPAVSVVEVLTQLRSGRTVLRKLTVPEGLTSAQVLQLLRTTEGLQGDIAETPAEGSLLPATYTYRYGDSRAALLEQMQGGMRRTVAALWEKRAPDLPLKTAEEAVVLASIVEKETGVADERQRVAAVFLNRLRAGMRLQADPTVAYGAGAANGPLGRALTKADLLTPTPFNTYLIDGLPPGPIANPGRAALAAVLRPLQSDELYFVADGSGGHAFARSYEEHRRNVERWRALQGATRDDDDSP